MGCFFDALYGEAAAPGAAPAPAPAAPAAAPAIDMARLLSAECEELFNDLAPRR
jgi:hypothetical protein